MRGIYAQDPLLVLMPCKRSIDGEVALAPICRGWGVHSPT